jgi:predicted DsbA family dithiol-disulfide isomerase
LREYAIDIRWLAFPLHPEIPAEGATLEQLFKGRGVDTAAIAQRLKQVAEGLGLPLAPSGTVYNTRLAQEMVKWAESKSKGHEIHQALFRAYFVEGRNIGQIEELAEIASSAGLSGEEARQAVESGTYKAAVDADWSRSRTLAVSAVPTFAMEGRRLVGFQPYEAIEQFVTAMGVARRNGC